MKLLRRVFVGAMLCAGCTAPLILAEEPGIDAPLVPRLPDDARAPADAGADAREGPSPSSDPDSGDEVDSGFADPQNVPDGGNAKLEAGLEDAGGD